MKRLYLILTLVLLTALSSGCRTGRCRLRGAKCRPGMSMPTYTQPPAQVPGQPPGDPCYNGYPPAAYSPAYPPTGYAYPPAGAYGPSTGYITNEGTATGEVVVPEFPTSPIEGPTQVLQRPVVSSPIIESTEDASVITVPGPEMGPLPNG